MDLKEINTAQKLYGYLLHNSELPNAREVDQYELAKTGLTHYTPIHVNYKQAVIQGQPRIVCGHYMIFPNATGVFFGMVHEQTDPNRPFMRPKIAIFAFGCDHTYKAMTKEERDKYGIGPLGNCEHAEICTQCEHRFLYDSGD